MALSVERVRDFLRPLGLAGRIREFDESSATVPLAAKALGVAEERIAKTLSFRGNGGGALLVVCAGDARIDNPKFKAAFGTKAKMLSPEEALELTGYQPGGVCPFALKEGTRLYLDESLRRFETVYPAAGSASSAVELSPLELQQASGGQWADVCRLPDGNEGAGQPFAGKF